MDKKYQGWLLMPPSPTPDIIEAIAAAQAEPGAWPHGYGPGALEIRRHKAVVAYQALLSVGGVPYVE